MMPYCTISIANQAGFGFALMILMLGSMFLTTGSFVLRFGKRYCTAGTVLLAVVLFLAYMNNNVVMYAQGSIIGLSRPVLRAAGLPWLLYVVILAGIASAEAVIFIMFLRRKKAMLVAGAIKESLDSLPDGICFYESGGQPLLVNMQMNRLSGEVSGQEIMNAELFIRRLKEKKVPDRMRIIRTEPTVLLETVDGSVWDFRIRSLIPGKPDTFEIAAFNITEQYRSNRELKKRNERLEQVNERLRRFSEEMVSFTAEKELLNAKIGIHDNIGRSLLAFRTYLSQPAKDRDRKKLLFLWRYVFSVMKMEASPSDDWDLLEKAAEMLHILINLDGELPKNLKWRNAVIAAIRECLTNTSAHAGGDRLTVKIRSCGGDITAEFTNTGRPPEGEIQETGGLKNLRRIVEQAGGSMTIESCPRFLMRLEFRNGGISE